MEVFVEFALLGSRQRTSLRLLREHVHSVVLRGVKMELEQLARCFYPDTLDIELGELLENRRVREVQFCRARFSGHETLCTS